jgi:putative transposase
MNIKSSKVNREKMDWLMNQPVNIQLSIVAQHLDICKLVINSLLDQNVEELCGKKYSRDKPLDGRYSRWGFNPGSIKMGNQKLKVDVPRVYDNAEAENIPVEMYDKLQEIPEQSEEVMRTVLHGISMRDYQKVAVQLIDSFGISASTISRHFIEHSQAAVEEFCSRSLAEQQFIGLFIDGKHFAKEQMIVALGVTIQGDKIPLSVIQSSSENAKAISQMLSELIERGLKFDDGLLCVIDGSKGIRKAIDEIFGSKAVVQRCQWHKRENVVSYLKQDLQKQYRKKLQQAYSNYVYQEAKNELLEIAETLRPINVQAAKSLEEGLEETLTIQRLGLARTFGVSFNTTNCIENLNSQLSKYTRKVKRWMNSEQRYRWVISSLLEIEKNMKRVQNCRQLHQLADAIEQETRRTKQPSNFN